MKNSDQFIAEHITLQTPQLSPLRALIGCHIIVIYVHPSDPSFSPCVMPVNIDRTSKGGVSAVRAVHWNNDKVVVT